MSGASFDVVFQPAHARCFTGRAGPKQPGRAAETDPSVHQFREHQFSANPEATMRESWKNRTKRRWQALARTAPRILNQLAP